MHEIDSSFCIQCVSFLTILISTKVRWLVCFGAHKHNQTEFMWRRPNIISLSVDFMRLFVYDNILNWQIGFFFYWKCILLNYIIWYVQCAHELMLQFRKKMRLFCIKYSMWHIKLEWRYFDDLMVVFLLNFSLFTQIQWRIFFFFSYFNYYRYIKYETMKTSCICINLNVSAVFFSLRSSGRWQ